jgi:DNA-binding NarL/FixJ family response regulator
LYVKSRFIKNILLKSVVKAQIGVIDIIDPDDMTIKLDAYGDSIVLAVIEITDDNKASVYEVVNRIKDVYPSVPVVAIVYKDTYEIVNFAIRLGVKDILFLTKNVETYVEAIQNKMANYYDIIKKQEKDTFLSEMINEDINIRESLNLELKRAIRGNYSISFILAYLSGHEPEVVQSIINTSKRFIRDTDKLLLMDEDTFIAVFPFVEKANVPLLEEKFREAFKKESKRVGIHKKFCLYGATFPDDGDSLEQLLDRLEKGINNSLVISSVQIPLSSLTVSDIEEYKKKIRQYKKFF